MNRTLFAVASAVTLVLGVSSFAGPPTDMREAPPSLAVTAAGAALPAAMPQGTVPTNEKAVSGEVVMWTPNQLILHTAKGVERFQITPQTAMLAGAAEGDRVTVFYTGALAHTGGTAGGSARVTTGTPTKVGTSAGSR